jgi:hypothetical protein
VRRCLIGMSLGGWALRYFERIGEDGGDGWQGWECGEEMRKMGRCCMEHGRVLFLATELAEHVLVDVTAIDV